MALYPGLFQNKRADGQLWDGYSMIVIMDMYAVQLCLCSSKPAFLLSKSDC